MTYDQARNVAVLLAADPLYYRNYGPYWWHVKAELRRLGFGEQLEFLGAYEDPSAKQFTDGVTPGDMARTAFAFQRAAMTEGPNRNEHVLDGVSYTVRDGDVE